uniref:Uncharacterized protein n=2 Tax=Brassica oleracea TaxID=3712 RepID=A0A0D3APD4_BRAOL|nr:unnamed protein product [Brassica oleracea]
MRARVSSRILNRGSGCENSGENDGDNGGEITGGSVRFGRLTSKSSVEYCTSDDLLVLIPTTDHPALNVSLNSCERIHVSGYPRTKLGKYAHSFRVKLAPLVLSREATQKNSGLCSPVAIPVLVGIIITGAAFGFWTVRKFVVSEDEGVDVSVDQFVKWATRSVAATFLFQHNGYSFADGSFHFS